MTIMSEKLNDIKGTAEEMRAKHEGGDRAINSQREREGGRQIEDGRLPTFVVKAIH